MMKYIIMADGKGTRWQHPTGLPKHLMEVNGESLLARTVRLLRQAGCQDIVITSHDPRYEIEGAVRYEPKHNNLEIDRFTEELIEDDVCFMYGDTFYSEDSIQKISEMGAEDVLFFGTDTSIVAIKVFDGQLFKSHVDRVRQLFLDGKIEKCIGWQVYQSMTGLPFGDKVIGDKYVRLPKTNVNINRAEDFKEFSEEPKDECKE